jgi:two-component system CheB/CheR fusion protein
MPDGQAPGRPLRVLVVDDDRDNANSLATVIGLWGHIAKAAYGGQEALYVTRSFRADVALIDLGMPNMDGGKVALELRQRPGECPLLLALTGYSPASVEDNYPTAFDRCILKPPELRQLQAILAAAPKLSDGDGTAAATSR